MNQESPIHRYQAHSRAYLERAKGQLTTFDESGDVSALFYAALELRYGIEARAWEYLSVAFKSLGRSPESVKGFSASDLLRRLAKADPDSHRESVLAISDEQSRQAMALQYTPVSRELAKIHGRLGALLHHRFFVDNELWYLKQALPLTGPQSLGNFRELLVEGIAGLEYATSGTLLANAKFTALVSEMSQESVRCGPQDDE
jgi:hypothetical protein